MISALNRSSALQRFECSNSMMKSGLLFECEPLSLTSILSMHPSLVPRTLSILCSIGSLAEGLGTRLYALQDEIPPKNRFGQVVVCVVHGIAMHVYEGVTWSIKQVHLYIHLYIMSSFFSSGIVLWELGLLCSSRYCVWTRHLQLSHHWPSISNSTL